MGCIDHKQRLGNILFSLLVFLFAADPTNTVFGLKIPLFALLLTYNIIFFRAEWGKLRYFAISLTAMAVPWLFALFRGEVIDAAEACASVTAITPLLLLPWLNRYNVLSLSVVPVVAVVVIVLFLYWLIFFQPRLEGALYLFMCAHDHTIMMSRRAFLGVTMFGMYCKSTVAFLPVFALLLYKVFDSSKRTVWSVALFLLFIHLFLISGTRSTIVLPVFLALSVFFLFYRNKRYYNYVIYSLGGVVVITILFLLIMLLFEVDEYSNMVKYAHISSYRDLWRENPLYLLFGQGPGTAFYSEGFQRMTFKTEWSYLELLRCYGVFSLLIIYTFLRPLFSLLRLSYRSDEALVLTLAYMTYLFIAGTNPLLLSSTGMLVLLSVFGYVGKAKVAGSEYERLI